MTRIVLNPHSGVRTATEDQLRTLFPGCTVTRLSRGVDLRVLAQSDPPGLPYIAAGGDGTVNAVAQAVAGTGRPMGVLALGTLNHFARDLGLPLDLTAAAQVIAAGHTRCVDAAEVNGRIFVNNSSLGAYPAMVLDRERMKKSGRNKWASLVLASARAFLRFRCATVDMSAEGRAHCCTTPFLFVGNNEYCLDGVRLGRREHLNAGTLALYLAPGASRAGVLRMAFAALFGRLRQTPEYEEFLVPAFTVHVRGRRRLRVSFDGEVRRMPGPLHYRILPHALTVLCPEGPSPAEAH
jgi:diacylglycerol kinase family enzyme